MMEQIIHTSLTQSISAKQQFAESQSGEILKIVEVVVAALTQGNKILIFGNGGSASDSQHLAAEFVNRFLIDRVPLPAIALTTDTSILTSIANDFSFSQVFAKQITALGRAGDIAIGISTSGNSENVVEGFIAAKKIGITTIALSGCCGGKLKHIADLNLIVPSDHTPVIQEVHLWVEHLLCQLVDERMFGNASQNSH